VQDVVALHQNIFIHKIFLESDVFCKLQWGVGFIGAFLARSKKCHADSILGISRIPQVNLLHPRRSSASVSGRACWRSVRSRSIPGLPPHLVQRRRQPDNLPAGRPRVLRQRQFMAHGEPAELAIHCSQGFKWVRVGGFIQSPSGRLE